ncbi:MAG: TMEM14 family protein [Candidatus Rhabdochlamydia sp.]
MIANILIFIYTLFLFTGSLIGYIKAGSTASLIMGTLFSTVLLCFLFLSRKNRRISDRGIIITLFILDAFFTFRWIKTAHFVPAGVLSLFTLATLFSFCYLIKQKKIV